MKTVFFNLLLFSTVSIFSQNNVISLTGKYQTGLILPHYKSMNYIIENKIKAFDIVFGLSTKGKKNWHKLHKYPTVGFGYSYANLGNNEILGSANSVYSYINKSFFKTNKFKINYDLAAGIAYLNKPFDKKNNVSNFVIGSHINAYLHVYADIKYLITKNTAINASFGITHFSNGASKQPNKGLNQLTGALGATYFFNNIESFKNNSINENKKSNFKKKFEFIVIYSGGKKENFPTWNKKYYISSLIISGNRSISEKSKLGLGLDLFYDPSLETKYTKKSEPKNTEFIFPGIHFSYDIVFGKLSFTMQQGIHPILPPSDYPLIFQRWGLRYRFYKNLIASVSLKSYMGFAQMIEFGIGYKLQ